MKRQPLPADRKVAVDAIEAAELLSMSESQIRRLVAAGALARVPNTGNRLIIARAEIDRFASVGVSATPRVWGAA